jgi:hypothetical protein
MKKSHFLLLLGFIIGIGSMNSQTLKTEKEIRREDAKVDTVFTVDERAKIEYWFNDRVNQMNLSDETREEFDNTFYSYVYKMSRVNDKDKNYTEDELQNAYDDVIVNMNASMKAILTNDQYINFLENFGKINRMIYQKYGWED